MRNRLRLAELLLKAGGSAESLSKLLSWREFERFCRNVLEENGFRVRSNVRFKRGAKRYEIDLVAVKSPYLLFVDCKHWKPGVRAGYKEAARKQRVRMEAALEKESPIGINWEPGLSGLQRISLIVSLADVTDLSFEGMPVVPIFRFNSFLMGLDQFWGQFSIQSIGDSSLEDWTGS